MGTDCRSGRGEVQISKLKYICNYAHCININDLSITEKEVLLRKKEWNKKKKKIDDSLGNGLHLSGKKRFPSLCLFHQQVYEIQATLYHSANIKREKIVSLHKMFKHLSPSCQHQQPLKSPKTSSPYVCH